jgi:hypothetical protein
MKVVKSTSQVRFCLPANVAHKVVLCNLNGKIVASHSGTGDWIMPAHTLARGIYFFKGMVGGRIVSEKLVADK